jgi:outer membrane lipoprotein-sorting protein
MATAQGILLLRRNYVPAFVTDPSPVPLESGSNEMVIKLRLTRRVGSENFREIFLDIASDTKLIRRIEGTTITDSTVRFDFSETKINQGIPEQRFIYDSPASANLYNNFLFRDSE